MGNELMKARYKVIADYPLRYFEIGEIFYPADEKNYCVVEGGYFSSDLTKYPHLFKKLFWWQEINIDEMPEYVKDIPTGKIFKPYELKQQWGGRAGMFSAISPEDESDVYWKKECVPATLEEYNTYIQSKQQ